MIISKMPKVKKSKVLNTAGYDTITFVIRMLGRDDKDGDGNR